MKTQSSKGFPPEHQKLGPRQSESRANHSAWAIETNDQVIALIVGLSNIIYMEAADYSFLFEISDR